MFRILKIAGAVIGVVIGAGYASGQEVLQYFTSFGHRGTYAAILATALLAYMGMIMANVGSRLRATSHRTAIYQISGRHLGMVIDGIIIFTLFGTGVLMMAGAGSTLNQQFGLPVFVGSLIMAVIVAISMMLKVEKIISVIASVTPLLLLFAIFIFIYSLSTMEMSFAELKPIAESQDKPFSNWIVAAVNYASLCVALGVSMTFVIGGAEKNSRIAAISGLLGGLGIGIMVTLAHLAIFSQVNVVASFDLPLLKIVEDISPVLAFLYSIVLFGMIFNSVLGMFYSFIARFFKMGTKKSYIATVIALAIGFALSFVGFTTLVSRFYTLVGYLGLLLMVILIYAPFKLKRSGQKGELKGDKIS